MQFTTILTIAFAAAGALAAPQAVPVAAKPVTTKPAATTAAVAPTKATATAPASAATGTALPTAVPETFSYTCKCASARNVPDDAVTEKACAAVAKSTKFTYNFNDFIGACDARDATRRLAVGLSVSAFSASCAKLGTAATPLVADCQ